MNYSFVIGATISLIFFLIFFALALYIFIIFILSKGFKVSPTVSSNKKSIIKIKEYIEDYLLKTDKTKIRILDIGSGYGNMIFGINKDLKVPNGKSVEFVGYEISELPYKISQFRNKYSNITFIKDDINNLKDFDFDIVLTFILAKQQKLFLNIYRKFSKNTMIIANSLPIPFDKDDEFELIDTIKVLYRWNVYIYKMKKS